MLVAGVASLTSTGRLIDRFRDRLVFPITHDGHILGFVARRNPSHVDDQHGPKYLNTAETPLFHKGDQLYIPVQKSGALPVLVEGPVDALAVAIATNGAYAGAAALGTSLTDAQATRLVAMSPTPIIAADADEAGQAATFRDYWMLASRGGRPRTVELPKSADPAALLADGHAERLTQSINNAGPLAQTVLLRHLEIAPGNALQAIHILAAAPAELWSDGVKLIADRCKIPEALVKVTLAPLVQAWNRQPDDAARAYMTSTRTASQGTDTVRRTASLSRPPGIERRTPSIR